MDPSEGILVKATEMAPPFIFLYPLFTLLTLSFLHRLSYTQLLSRRNTFGLGPCQFVHECLGTSGSATYQKLERPSCFGETKGLVWFSSLLSKVRNGDQMCASRAQACTLLSEEKTCFPWFLGPEVMVNTGSYPELGHQESPGTSCNFTSLLLVSASTLETPWEQSLKRAHAVVDVSYSDLQLQMSWEAFLGGT